MAILAWGAGSDVIVLLVSAGIGLPLAIAFFRPPKDPTPRLLLVAVGCLVPVAVLIGAILLIAALKKELSG